MRYPRWWALILLALLLTATRADAVGDGVFVTRPFADLEVGGEQLLDFAVLSGLGIMGGYGDGTVRPDEHVTWAAFARVCVALMEAEDLAEHYADIPPTGGEPRWAWGWINAGVRLGVVEPDVRWHVPVSWGEAVVGLLRTQGWDLRGPVELHRRRIIAAGITDEIPGDATVPVRRAQLAAMVRRLLDEPLSGTILELSEDRVVLEDGREFVLPAQAVVCGYLPGDPRGVYVELWMDREGRASVMNTPGERPPAESAVVLTYHHITLSEPGSTAEIHVEDFRRQMQYLAEEEYRVLSLGEFIEYHGTGGFPERSVVLTFDDGYRSFYTEAYPILVQHNFPAIVFPIVSRRPELNVKPVNFEHFSFCELRSMVTGSDLVDVGSHSYDLHHLRDCDALPAVIPEEGESAERYRWRVTTDLRLSRDILAEQTGLDIQTLAWPFGASTETVMEVAQSLGFRFIFDTEPGAVTPRTCLLKIPRLGVTSGCIHEFSDMLKEALSVSGS